MARLSVLVALIFLLAACTKEDALGGFAESRLPPSLSARFFPPDGWAWGFVQTGGQPMQRYGVASTSRVPQAIVVIVPGYGESAEVWFETARELIDQGCTVWVLDRAGQGGSARYAAPRDRGFVSSFGPDVANLRNLISQVIRPDPDVPVILLSQADGAVVALRALQTGAEADGLVAASPRLAPRGGAPGLQGLIPQARKSWSREDPDDLRLGQTHDPWRGAVRMAWQTANPDLRMAAPSAGWISAFQAASRGVEAEASLIRRPVLMFNPSVEAKALCGRLSACEARDLSGSGGALHLESDRWRAPFMTQVDNFIRQKVDDKRAQSRTRPGSNWPRIQ